ncbi:hypothetical protein [Saccharospirillum sp.]|uniref:hypothetical protein n=1 Tax=Saccharospirillum sp. TaxID=2033801 RepID=UPI00349FF5A7
MLSQSVRVTTAAESRYRIALPNSRGRKTLVLALGKSALTALAELQELEWNNTQFGFYASGELQLYQAQQTLRVTFNDLLDKVDVVVLLITADSDVDAIVSIGHACSERRVMTSGFILVQTDRDEATLNNVLACTRKVTVSLVADADTDTLIESLRAVRA